MLMASPFASTGWRSRLNFLPPVEVVRLSAKATLLVARVLTSTLGLCELAGSATGRHYRGGCGGCEYEVELVDRSWAVQMEHETAVSYWLNLTQAGASGANDRSEERLKRSPPIIVVKTSTSGLSHENAEDMQSNSQSGCTARDSKEQMQPSPSNESGIPGANRCRDLPTLVSNILPSPFLNSRCIFPFLSITQDPFIFTLTCSAFGIHGQLEGKLEGRGMRSRLLTLRRSASAVDVEEILWTVQPRIRLIY